MSDNNTYNNTISNLEAGESTVEKPSRDKGKKKKQKLPKKSLLIILGVLAVVVLVLLIYTIGLGPVDRKNDNPVVVKIPNGTGASQIVEILDEAGLVKSKTCAKINTKIGGYNSLQANSYVFSKSMSFPKMMSAINTGDFNYISKAGVTILAGDRISQIAEKMAAELPYTKEQFIAKWDDKEFCKKLIDKYWFLTNEILDENIIHPLEGYFYADTYFITDENESIEDATYMFLDRMDIELGTRKKEIKKTGFTIHQFLTLTSIVTKEGGSNEDELPTVAGIFMNRLNKGMSLGSDSTVNYIFDQDIIDITAAQLATESPYNTRINAGLPPSPICAVLNSRMDAVINYKKSNYLFFYHCPDGTAIFSETEEEHVRAVEQNPWPENQ